MNIGLMFRFFGVRFHLGNFAAKSPFVILFIIKYMNYYVRIFQVIIFVYFDFVSNVFQN